MPPKYKYKNKEITVSSLAKYLIIVESPSKCTKIEHYLGTDYACIATIGHLRNINGLKSINIKETFEPTYTFIQEKVEHINNMKKVIDKFNKNNILIASDDDREGESIAWHICDIFNLPINTTQRIIFHEITKPAIINAVQNPTIIDMKLVKAQQARQVLDIIVGYKISPYLWTYLFNNKEKSLSAGRCQTPTLKLVYENHLDNVNNNISFNYKIRGYFTSKNLIFDLNHEFNSTDDIINFLELSKVFNHTISIDKSKNIDKPPPKPFHTSSLLQTVNNLLHYSPKDTMNLCQQLYQSGYITYMRTESNKYSKTFIDKAEEYINKQYNEKYVGDNIHLINNNSSNPHEAIRVTQIDVTNISSDNSKLSTLYKLIWKNTIESCMSKTVYQNTIVKLSAPNKYKYTHTLEVPLFLGWKIINNKNISEIKEQSINASLLLYLKSLETISYQKIESNITYHNKHSYYTESSLIKKIESIGIGRPSTFASIVDTIQEREYVLKQDLEGIKHNCTEFILSNDIINKNISEKTFGNEKNKLIIQPIGLLCIEFLNKNFSNLFSYEYTGNMELNLDKISNGEEEDWYNICKNCYNEIKTMSKNLAKITKNNFEIEHNYHIVFEKYGPSMKHIKDNNEVEYIPLKPGFQINLDKLKNNEYKLYDLINNLDNCFGIFENEKMYIKSGQYGDYVQYGDNRVSLKNINTPISELTESIVINYLNEQKKKSTNSNILREINNDLSVRKGKYGPYIFYKTNNMNKPSFLNIKKFKGGPLMCDQNLLIDWLNTTYNLSISK